MEARLTHPIFDPIRPWVERLKDFSLRSLNLLSEKEQIRTEAGKPVRFVEPSSSDPYYEIHLFETGQVHTRPENKHDLFNALVWLAFPKTKARINAMHAREIPREGGRRGRLRDMLTIFDEGGAIVVGSDEVEKWVRQAAWKKLFIEKYRELRIVILGHAVLEQALAPYAGMTCKVIFARPGDDLDARCASWLATQGSSPRDLPPLPIMGYPGWYPGNDDPAFYEDARYFRPMSASREAALQRGKMPPGAGQAAAGPRGLEESPGSEERDAG